ncbi:hypothetical protein FLAVO9R_30467 [Flavobacterium sp. 9R]|nr:hypothetical protein FLAVO9R_30467 [Flavobacterium sp. 9R]
MDNLKQPMCSQNTNLATIIWNNLYLKRKVYIDVLISDNFYNEPKNCN